MVLERPAGRIGIWPRSKEAAKPNKPNTCPAERLRIGRRPSSRSSPQARVGRPGRESLAGGPDYSVYDRLNSDPDFAAAFNVGEDAADEMEDVARRRAKAKSDRLMMYFLNLRYRPPTDRKRGKLHLHLHQNAPQEQLRQKYEAMPDDELRRQYQEQIESKVAAGADAPIPAAGTGEVPA